MRKKNLLAVGIACFITVFSMCRKAQPFNDTGYDSRLSGGQATVFDASSKAFTHMIAGLVGTDLNAHERGDVAFEQTFVSAPAPVFGGLGPVFNNVSCISCHHNDGKGTPTAGTVTSSLLLRITNGLTDEHGGPAGVDGYGGQVQDVALFGIQPEAHWDIVYAEVPVTYPDGSTASLRKPTYNMQNAYKAISGGYFISPRLAPPVFGLGLLENIPEGTIASFADEADKDGDGIRGHVNYVYNPQTKQTEIGRFGLKANTPTIMVQVATAYQQDMGVTSMVRPQEASWGQAQCAGISGDNYDLPDSTLRAVAFYVKTLAVPARRDVEDAEVKRGEALFTQINCSGCHRTTVQTGMDVNVPALSNQRIHPYTDLLVHDMGDGLADGYTDFLANGREWRTTPLWGIGLFEKTNGTPYYLHDGRARSIEEAILWHGGEATNTKNKFMQLNKTDRNAVIRFLRSL
ncbi:MAG: c-type cytochrome [Bacteroidetes bacterium]|nr:c-type cytochrome [Bacteroidota bacterium]